jgi:hypothetical protein
MTIASAGIFAISILGLGSRFNPLRAGLLLGGLGVYLTGVGFWASSTDQWIGFVMTVLNFGVLAGAFLYLEEGIPLGPVTPVRRLEIPPAGSAQPPAPAAAPPVPPPPPPTFPAPPPRTLPPDHHLPDQPPPTEEPEPPAADNQPGPAD